MMECLWTGCSLDRENQKIPFSYCEDHNRLTRMEGALQFYANENNWIKIERSTNPKDFSDKRSAVEWEGNRVAKSALNPEPKTHTGEER